MKMYQREFPVEKMSFVLGVSSSAYFAWKNGTSTKRIEKELRLKEKVEQIYNGSHYTYGSPRVFSILKGVNEKVSRSLVARVMRKYGFRSLHAKSSRLQLIPSTAIQLLRTF